MSGRMDKVDPPLVSVHSDQKKEAKWVVGNAMDRLKVQILVEVDKKL